MKKHLIAAAMTAALLQTTGISAASATVDPALAAVMQKQQSASARLVALSDHYIEETLPRQPIMALFNGDNRFNHLWPNSLAV